MSLRKAIRRAMRSANKATKRKHHQFRKKGPGISHQNGPTQPKWPTLEQRIQSFKVSLSQGNKDAIAEVVRRGAEWRPT